MRTRSTRYMTIGFLLGAAIGALTFTTAIGFGLVGAIIGGLIALYNSPK